MKTCDQHANLMKDIGVIQTDVKWLVKREEEKQEAWEKKQDKTYNHFWKVIGLIFLVGSVFIAYLELFQ